MCLLSRNSGGLNLLEPCKRIVLYGCEELSFSIRGEHSYEGVCREGGEENILGREEVAGNSSKLGDDDKLHASCSSLNPLNPELNPICYLLALLGAHHFLHVSRIRVK
jgi:hypothetical protein